MIVYQMYNAELLTNNWKRMPAARMVGKLTSVRHQTGIMSPQSTVYMPQKLKNSTEEQTIDRLVQKLHIHLTVCHRHNAPSIMTHHL